MKRYFFLLVCLTGFFLSGCATKKYKNVKYLNSFTLINAAEPKLNIFVPRHKKQESLPVLIYVHGGNWNTGNKDIYGFFGRNFAKKQVITVLPDYTKSPDATYNEMTHQIAEAIRWTQQHISEYGGDPAKIYLTGHSAGGHLISLATLNPKYNIDPKSISGIILNDAAGLDMKHYLEENPPNTENNYLTTWSNKPETWRDASPIYFLDEQSPPFMIYIGNKTYPSIKVANARFLEALQPLQPAVEPIRPNKKHIPMILQYFWPWSPRFDEVIAFMLKK